MTTPAAQLDAPEFLARAGVSRVLSLLGQDGEEARVVGGAVRNHLMGRPIADIDICTTAVPDVVIARARAAGVHAVPTGYEHGTVTLVVGGVPHEVTTLREDIATDGRRAVVCFGRDFRADAIRRDFTINALSVDAAGNLFDYGGGLADIAAQRVRFIGDADQRITEDYLRILRFFRFSAAFGNGTLEAEGMAASVRNRSGLDRLSRERVRQEMMKLLVAPHAAPVMARMDAAGFLDDVLGARGDVAACERMMRLEAEHALGCDAARRLMALAVRSGADVQRLRERLRLTNREDTQFSAVLAAQALQNVSLREQLYRQGPEIFREAQLFRAAVCGGQAGLAEALALPQVWTVPKFLITGTDILALGVAEGPDIGRLLAATEARWIAAGMPAAREDQMVLLTAI